LTKQNIKVNIAILLYCYIAMIMKNSQLNKLNNNPTQGFSLVEILVVVAIIAIIVAIAIPALSSSKSDAQDKATQASLYSLNIALARAYKNNDPQFLEGGLLHSGSTNTVAATAYLIQKGYLR
jgi:prepilin-type N-terminal cleavage/methylation domain-containing protein